ncbi:MAG: DUF177 domain-containing protein [Bacteroidetes bacterium]|nr:DUF177 domain-containing protein [Bacteroidota bacterium]
MSKTHKHIPVRLSGLADGIHALDYDVPPADLDLPPEFGETVVVHVDLDKTHKQITLRVHVDTVAVYPCDRCLEPVRIPVHTEVVLVYAHDNSDRAEEENDIRDIPAHDSTVDIADDVRDAALLCIPMRRICGENADGQSLCPRPIPDKLRTENHERSDPRWDALKSLNLDQ